jgi:hypothetical protein
VYIHPNSGYTYMYGYSYIYIHKTTCINASSRCRVSLSWHIYIYIYIYIYIRRGIYIYILYILYVEYIFFIYSICRIHACLFNMYRPLYMPLEYSCLFTMLCLAIMCWRQPPHQVYMYHVTVVWIARALYTGSKTETDRQTDREKNKTGRQTERQADIVQRQRQREPFVHVK